MDKMPELTQIVYMYEHAVAHKVSEMQIVRFTMTLHFCNKTKFYVYNNYINIITLLL